ncbi:MAG: hypothetical protein AAB257_09570, partial [Nitrospinota bacterium]
EYFQEIHKELSESQATAAAPKKKTEGIGSDYDKTVAEGKALEDPNLKHIIDFLKNGVYFAIMSGNDIEIQKERVLTPIIKYLNNQKLNLEQKRAILKYLSIYAAGVGMLVSFSLNDQDEISTVIDEKYSRSNQISPEFIYAIKEDLEKIVKDYNNQVLGQESNTEAFSVEGEYTTLFRGKGLKPQDRTRPARIEFRGAETRRDSDRLLYEKGASVNSNFSDQEKVIITQLALAGVHTHVRDEIIAKILKFTGDKNNDWLGEYEVQIGGGKGGFTIEIVRKINGDPLTKVTAMRHFIQTHNLTPEAVKYFGDEFTPGENDWPIYATKDPQVSKVEIYAVNAKNPPPDEFKNDPRVHYQENRKKQEGTAEYFQEIHKELSESQATAAPKKKTEGDIDIKATDIFRQQIKEALGILNPQELSKRLNEIIAGIETNMREIISYNTTLNGKFKKDEDLVIARDAEVKRLMAEIDSGKGDNNSLKVAEGYLEEIEKIRNELARRVHRKVNRFSEHGIFSDSRAFKLARKFASELRDASKREEIKEKSWSKIPSDLQNALTAVYGASDAKQAFYDKLSEALKQDSSNRINRFLTKKSTKLAKRYADDIRTKPQAEA